MTSKLYQTKKVHYECARLKNSKFAKVFCFDNVCIGIQVIQTTNIFMVTYERNKIKWGSHSTENWMNTWLGSPSREMAVVWSLNPAQSGSCFSEFCTFICSVANYGFGYSCWWPCGNYSCCHLLLIHLKWCRINPSSMGRLALWAQSTQFLFEFLFHIIKSCFFNSLCLFKYGCFNLVCWTWLDGRTSFRVLFKGCNASF